MEARKTKIKIVESMFCACGDPLSFHWWRLIFSDFFGCSRFVRLCSEGNEHILWRERIREIKPSERDFYDNFFDNLLDDFMKSIGMSTRQFESIRKDITSRIK